MKSHNALFIKGCQNYIEGKYPQALEAFNAAREVKATVWIDMWRARTMMDMMDYFHAMQLLQWMTGEYADDIRVQTMIALAHLELLTLQPKLTTSPAITDGYLQ